MFGDHQLTDRALQCELKVVVNSILTLGPKVPANETGVAGVRPIARFDRGGVQRVDHDRPQPEFESPSSFLSSP